MKLPILIVKYAMACAVGLGLFSAQAQDAPKPDNHGIAVADIDRSVKPGDDFFAYTNGEGLKRIQIPPDRASVSVFSTLNDIANKRTATLIEEAAKSSAAAGSGTRKISDVYKS